MQIKVTELKDELSKKNDLIEMQYKQIAQFEAQEKLLNMKIEDI